MRTRSPPVGVGRGRSGVAAKAIGKRVRYVVPLLWEHKLRFDPLSLALSRRARGRTTQPYRYPSSGDGRRSPGIDVSGVVA